MLIRYLSRTKLLVLLFFTAFGAILELAGLAMFVPLILLLLEDDGITKNEYLSKIYERLDVGSYGTFLVLVCCAVFLFTILKNLLLHKINTHRYKVLLELFSLYSTALFKGYYKKGLQFIKESSSTALSHNTNSICYSYVFGVLGPAFTLAGDLVLTVLIITSLAFVNIYIAAIEVVLFLPLIFFYQILIVDKLQKAGKADNEAKKNQWRITMETFRGYAEVEVNNAFPKLMNIFRSGLKAISEAKERTEGMKSIASKSIEIGVILVITSVVVTFYFVVKDGESFRVLIGIFAIATLKLMPAVRSLVTQYSSIKSNMFTMEIIKEIDDQKDSVTQSIEHITQDPLLFNNKIEFRKVGFGFSGRDLIIDNLSITITKGEKVGIKGMSGSGKSTFLNLLLGLYRPIEGGVYIDNVLLNNKNDGEWHKRVAYVSQDIFIMDTTLEENIAMENIIDYERLNNAIEGASLKELVDNLPLGLASRIGEGGCRLSGGERQRVAIARALYKRADVLLLDEPTSSLDKKTEIEITETLKKPAFREKNITLLIISHRDSMLNICERVIDLSK